MTKLKAESELQQSQLMEYEVASEHHEQQKSRLEEEVKELMKKVQEMEGARQKKDLDASSKVSELEGKVRFCLECTLLITMHFLLEWFSIECRKPFEVALTSLYSLCDWFKNHALLSEPIRCRAKAKRDLVTCVFPARLTPVT